MKRMYAEEELEAVIKANSKKYYIHNVTATSNYDGGETTISFQLLNSSNVPVTEEDLRTIFEDSIFLRNNDFIILGYGERGADKGKLLVLGEETVQILKNSGTISTFDFYPYTDEESGISLEIEEELIEL